MRLKNDVVTITIYFSKKLGYNDLNLEKIMSLIHYQKIITLRKNNPVAITEEDEIWMVMLILIIITPILCLF